MAVRLKGSGLYQMMVRVIIDFMLTHAMLLAHHLCSMSVFVEGLGWGHLREEWQAGGPMGESTMLPGEPGQHTRSPFACGEQPAAVAHSSAAACSAGMYQRTTW